MHLLQAQAGAVADGEEPVDPGQTPAELVVISANDDELAALAAARARLGDAAPSLRLTRLLWLRHPYSVDRCIDDTLSGARLVVARLLGGEAYWPYGLEQCAARLSGAGVAFAALPGDDKPDPALDRASTLPAADRAALWSYLVEGGPENAERFLLLAAHLLGRGPRPAGAAPLLRAGAWAPQGGGLEALRAQWTPGAPVVPIVFYRSLLQGAGPAPVAALAEALRTRGANALPVFVASLKDPVSAGTLAALFDAHPPEAVLNLTGFAVGAPGADRAPTPLDAPGAPVLQVVMATEPEGAWAEGDRGLGPRDIAMAVALPEVDGRVLAGAVSFKGPLRHDADCQCPIFGHAPRPDRVAHVADQALAWARLRRAAPAERRVALILANYPNRDGRLANGVGLDTPAATVEALSALAAAGYDAAGAPQEPAALMRLLTAGPTNAAGPRQGGAALPLADYRAAFAALPASAQAAVTARWGAPEADPWARDGAFRLGVHVFGGVAVGVQPARGYNIDPAATHHSPDLVPPHGYLAFYVWLRRAFGAHAVVHMGKHGNLEWLPGKALALSAACWPEIALGPVPHLYPFIVNDPGEGAQAKRRAHAVVVDHLTPPLTRAETYGPLRELEALVDEYYEAAGVDPRRTAALRADILALTAVDGLDRDVGIAAEDDADSRLRKLDDYLCALKESQIRDGLHVFGRSPEGRLETDLLAALARCPRGDGAGCGASLIRALAEDLGLGFDPLDCAMAEPWTGPRPAALAALTDDVWRSCGDAVERLELLAARLIEGAAPDPAWTRAVAVLGWVRDTLRPALRACGAAETAGLLAGLDGRFVAPGPSGAPTRGRPDVLPTGRNFYSVDTRAVPTPAAWTLGWKSASLLIERHAQEHGDWPQAIALTAWGTACMRTGGDDAAQALALMGCRPRWDAASRRVTGFEVMPLGVLGRPRVDVTLRVSGFFRDAFPGLIDLVDSAARAVMALEEPAADNPAAARFRAETARLAAAGLTAADAARRAGWRVFGAKPGAYGAGLQALIDERLWDDKADLAEAFLVWGGHAYGGGSQGAPARPELEARLRAVDAVVQNQDNREHDLLDSDDYYQFEGGMAATVEALTGRAPTVYHNDHSRPERPVIRTLEEEIGRVMRARVVNPKWIAGVRRHGYKGAFEIAATVDYMFAFAATTHAVRDHHFDLAHAAFLADEDVRAFLAEANPDALREIAARLLEAQDRGLWRPRSNAARGLLEDLAA